MKCFYRPRSTLFLSHRNIPRDDSYIILGFLQNILKWAGTYLHPFTTGLFVYRYNLQLQTMPVGSIVVRLVLWRSLLV